MKNEINIMEKLTQPEKHFVSDLKHIAGEARWQAYRSLTNLRYHSILTCRGS